MEDKQLMEEVVRILDSKKADDIRAIRIGDLTILADYFVIAAGNSNTQVKMLADEVEYQLSQKGVKPHSTEATGRKTGSCWTIPPSSSTSSCGRRGSFTTSNGSGPKGNRWISPTCLSRTDLTQR